MTQATNKEVAISFLRHVVSGKIREAYATYVTKDMRHHSMMFAGDAASLEKAMEENHSQFPDKLLDVKRALEDGDLVAVHSHVRLRANEPGFAAVHIFRFEGHRIVEMWDIGQPVPQESPNKNGMF